MCKDQILTQMRDAFGAQDEMSLKASLRGITPEEAQFSPAPGLKSIQELVLHIADCKVLYCTQGFGTGDIQIQEPGIAGAVAYLEAAQQTMERCLQGLSEADLAKPIATTCHGQSAAHFFWIMAMHDIWHGGQIRTRRTLFAANRQAQATISV